jgi:hypothetical protein
VYRRPTVRQRVQLERSGRSVQKPLARASTGDPRASLQALGHAIGNRALGALLARQQASPDVPRAPILNPADPRLRPIFEAPDGSAGATSQTDRPELPPWMPRPRRLLPIEMGKGTKRAPKLKEPDGPGEAKCRGACGVDCPDSCETVGTYTEEYIVGDTSYIIEFPNAIICGTHAGCREHDACFDHAVRQGEREMGGPMHNGCNLQALAKYGPEKTKSWMRGGGPYDDRWYFVDEPWVKHTRRASELGPAQGHGPPQVP